MAKSLTLLINGKTLKLPNELRMNGMRRNDDAKKNICRYQKQKTNGIADAS